LEWGGGATPFPLLDLESRDVISIPTALQILLQPILAGLTVPPARIEKVLDQDIYLIERFDRTPHGATYFRTPFISGLTITGAHESES